MFRRTALLLLVTAGLAAGVTPALAGKGGSSSGTSSITIATVNGAATAATTSALRLGSTLTFATTVASLAGWEYPMVALTCYQDVNGDGVVNTSMSGPDMVYGQLEKPSATFSLGGYPSAWTTGQATCRADLDAYGWKGGKESIRILATTGNWAALG